MASNEPKLNNFKLPTLNNNPPPSRQFSRNEMSLKKPCLGEMLIEQISEFELRVPGSLVVHIPKTGYFHDKTKKSSKANLRVHYLLLKMLQKKMYFTLIFLTLAKSQNLTPKCKILNVFWT